MKKCHRNLIVVMSLIITVFSFGMSFAQEGIPNANRSVVMFPESFVHLVAVPGGSSTSVLGTENQIRVRLLDGYGAPVVDYPRELLGLYRYDIGTGAPCLSNNSHSEPRIYMIADENTDSDGCTTFTGSISGGGSMGPENQWPGFMLGVEVITNAYSVDLFFLRGLDHGSPIICETITYSSPDINADGVVNLVDVGYFGEDHNGEYNFRSDFDGDGNVNLIDVAIFASHMGATCD